MDYRRITLVDELRGIALILMVVFHFMYTLSKFQVELGRFSALFMAVIQPISAGLFILIAGFSSVYSRNNGKRGLITLACGFGVTIVTVLFIPSQAIYFGILHFLGTSMLLYAPIQHYFRRPPVHITIPVCILLFYLTFRINRGYLQVPFFNNIALPAGAYQNPLFSPLGFPSADFSSADYYPMLPWGFLFLIGTQIGVMSTVRTLPDFVYRSRAAFLSAVGKKTMPIYLLHQPIIYGTLLLVLAN